MPDAIPEPTRDFRDVLADRISPWVEDDGGIYNYVDALLVALDDAGYDVVPQVVVERLNAANANLTAEVERSNLGSEGFLEARREAGEFPDDAILSAGCESPWHETRRVKRAPTCPLCGVENREAPVSTFSEWHPHEPIIPRSLDDEGRCRVCRLMTERDEAIRAVERLTEALRDWLAATEAAHRDEPGSYRAVAEARGRARAVLGGS